MALTVSRLGNSLSKLTRQWSLVVIIAALVVQQVYEVTDKEIQLVQPEAPPTPSPAPAAASEAGPGHGEALMFGATP